MLGQVIGYARVSSNGQNLDVQIDKLKNFGCYKIYQEKLSGLDQNRPELIKCIEYLREGDSLVVTRLDRIARSAHHLGQIVENLKEKNINFVVIDQSIDTNTPQGNLMFHMLSAFAQFENELRKERQLDGIKKAKEKGIKFGRPNKLDSQLVHLIYEEAHNISPTPVNKILSKYNISRRTFYMIKSGKHILLNT